MTTAQTMTTAEVSEKTGVAKRQLLIWQSEGRLTPNDNGKTGNGRRLLWTARDVKEVVALRKEAAAAKKNGEHRSACADLVDRLGGKAMIASLGRARAMRERLLDAEVIVAGPRGVRVVLKRSLVSKMLPLVGTPALVFERDTVP